MKYLIFISLLFCSLECHTQVIRVNMTRWSNYWLPTRLSLHDAILQDSVIVTSTNLGDMTYEFDFGNLKLFMRDTSGWSSVFEIIEVYNSPDAIINVDVRSGELWYNFLLSQDVEDKWVIVGRNFDSVEGRSIGMFSKQLTWIKED